MRGFSVLEMVVVMGIVTLVLVTAALNFSGIGLGLKTSGSADNIVLFIKDARQKSLAVKEFSGKYPSYGVAFRTATPDIITMYADCSANDNGGNLDDSDDFTDTNTCGGASNLVRTLTLPQPIRVRAIRTIPSNPPGSATPAQLFIEFIRPVPNIWISSAVGTVLPNGSAEIDIGDPAGRFTKTIVIWSNGLFNVK